MIKRAATLAAVCFVAAQAGDFDRLMEVAKSTWPERTRICVVGNYRRSAAEIQTLAEAAGEGSTIVVLDVDALQATDFRLPLVVANRIKPDYVVLLRNDPYFQEGILTSTWLVRQVAQRGIPSLGTTPRAIRQGAAFAAGPETGGEVLVNEEMKGTINVVLPAPVPVAGLRPGRAGIRVMGMQ